MSSQRYELEDGFRGMLCLSDMSSKTASSKDAGRFRSQKSTKDVCAACLIARALSETTSWMDLSSMFVVKLGMRQISAPRIFVHPPKRPAYPP